MNSAESSLPSTRGLVQPRLWPTWRPPFPHWLGVMVGVWAIPAVFVSRPAVGAERIYINYGPIERSIPVEALDLYAREGELPPELASYANLVTPEQLEQLREVLNAKAELSSVAVSQFLYTEQGETLLRRLGEIIQTQSRLSGFYALRAALILAADDPEEGLTPLNVLRKFPLEGLRIDLSRTLQVVSDLEQLINQTTRAVDAVVQQSEIEAAAKADINFLALPDLRRLGEYGAPQQISITLNDPSRDRTFPADIYLPVARSRIPGVPSALVQSAPLIVISHGLGSDRETYTYLAYHLASYGFAVAIPEHPGSNAEQLQALVDGRANEVTEPAEFINRPLDITYLLDELERRSQTDPNFIGHLNLERVGVIGQSFGGYTALALAGGTINFEQLAADCASEEDSLNLSLLLQCRAETLAQPGVNLKDERVDAIMAINPIGSTVLGQQGFSDITVPVMLVSGNGDTVAPALLEQIIPFTWLGTPNKYLLMIRGSTHFSTMGTSGSEVVELPPEVVGPDPALARDYIKAMSIAFFEVHLVQNPAYLDYLSSSYTNTISQPPLPINLVRFLTSVQVSQALGEDPLRVSTHTAMLNSRVPKPFDK